jgi:hypothetical protein
VPARRAPRVPRRTAAQEFVGEGATPTQVPATRLSTATSSRTPATPVCASDVDDRVGATRPSSIASRRAVRVASRPRHCTAPTPSARGSKPALGGSEAPKSAVPGRLIGAANHRPGRAHRTPLHRSARRRTRRPSVGAAGAQRSRQIDGSALGNGACDSGRRATATGPGSTSRSHRTTTTHVSGSKGDTTPAPRPERCCRFSGQPRAWFHRFGRLLPADRWWPASGQITWPRGSRSGGDP